MQMTVSKKNLFAQMITLRNQDIWFHKFTRNFNFLAKKTPIVSAYQVMSFIKYQYTVVPINGKRFSISTINEVVIRCKQNINNLVELP